MTEVSKNVQTSQTNYLCDHCKLANVVWDATPLYLHEHTCPNCNTKITLPKIYPYVTYK